MKLCESYNEYGIVVAHYLCDTCGCSYTITPAPESDDGWHNCLSPECESYDPKRDVDDLFED